jgi:hypothetical protein
MSILQTGPKTKKLLERALSRVLFVDEAYRLSEGHFAKEAMDELVGLLTQETFRGKLIVVLAGYTEEMNELLAVNTGLSSRFPDEVIFQNMSSTQCLEVLKRSLTKQSVCLDALRDPLSLPYAQMQTIFDSLSRLPSWGNARDVQTLAKQMVNVVFRNPETPVNAEGLLSISTENALRCMQTMLADRAARATRGPLRAPVRSNPPQKLDLPNAPVAPVTRTTQETRTAPPKPPQSIEETAEAPVSDGRDAGVSDAIWAQLQADKRAEETALQRWEEELQLKTEQLQRIAAQEREAERAAVAAALAEKHAKDAAELNELKRKREEARLAEHRLKQERARIQRELEEKRKEEERRRKEEARVQARLREMGVCPVGFRWIKQSSGYRCAGGSHFIDNVALGI